MIRLDFYLVSCIIKRGKLPDLRQKRRDVKCGRISGKSSPA